MSDAITKAIVLAIPTILGVVIGFFLSGGQRWFEGKRKLRAHCGAIRVEMLLCNEKVDALLSDPVRSPLYRLPTVALSTAFAILLAEGSLNKYEALATSRYFSHVQDLNRGLDDAAACVANGDMDGLGREYKRNLLKARHLIGKEGNENIMETARKIVDGKLLWWRQLL
jgi:hypothetical protein